MTVSASAAAWAVFIVHIHEADDHFHRSTVKWLVPSFFTGVCSANSVDDESKTATTLRNGAGSL